jgi:putative SOS response-associated peptidase YedK
MCGRFQLKPPEDWAEAYAVDEPPADAAPRYNIAPTQPIVGVRLREDGRREAAWLRWGLIPSWADDPAIGQRTINARAEGITSRPAFREPFRTRRCLIPATGFYEWKAMGRVRQPYLIERDDHAPFAFAGLWDRWTSPAGPVDSCTIITTEANARVAALHDRMPVILAREDYARWLDPRADEDALRALLRPFPPERLSIVPVSTRVNDVAQDDAECAREISPPPPPPEQKSLF